MDLREYFQKIREVEAAIEGEHVLVVSIPTSSGGMGGVKSEVTRANAAKLVVENRVRLASPEEVEEHRMAQDEARRMWAEQMASQRMQVTILSDRQIAELRKQRDREKA